MNASNHTFYFENLRRLKVPFIFSINRVETYKKGEKPYLETAQKYGYETESQISLAPWARNAFVNLLRLKKCSRREDELAKDLEEKMEQRTGSVLP